MSAPTISPTLDTIIPANPVTLVRVLEEKAPAHRAAPTKPCSPSPSAATTAAPPRSPLR